MLQAQTTVIMADQPRPEPMLEDSAPPESGDTRARLQSAILLLLMAGLFMALPFVLSIGSVVFLPPITAVVIAIVLAPLADRLTRIGLPGMLAALFAILTMAAVIVAALALILQPAFAMVDQVPDMLREVGRRFAELRGNLTWINDFNRQLARLTGHGPREVVLATPSVIEQVAFATPSVVLEVLLTLLMTFFMIDSHIRVKQRLQNDREHPDTSLRIARVMRDVQDRVAGYLLTVAQVNFGVGLIVAGGAWAYGLSAPVMWGGLAFVFNFLPYLGPLTIMGLLALVGLGTASSVTVGLLPALAFLALHVIEANFITPAILGKRFTLSPVSILLAISYFSWIWGVLGALLSVPILLIIEAMLENLGRPNLIGFLLGEPLFRGALPVQAPVYTDLPRS
jgi:predicted PurR-regulated permease PerM